VKETLIIGRLARRAQATSAFGRRSFFDNEPAVSAGILGILHLNSTVQGSPAVFASASVFGFTKINVRLAELEAKRADFRRDLGKRDAEADSILVNIGLWPAAAT
jgi:hypothetical protein